LCHVSAKKSKNAAGTSTVSIFLSLSLGEVGRERKGDGHDDAGAEFLE
jgi:hypothetical protein